MDSAKHTSIETQGLALAAPICEESDEPSGRAGRPGRSVLSHVATEQRRRDKINEGSVTRPLCSVPRNLLSERYKACAFYFCRFNALRELIPHKDKMDKATFLQQAVDYIRQLQVRPILDRLALRIIIVWHANHIHPFKFAVN